MEKAKDYEITTSVHGADLFDVLQFCGSEGNSRRYIVRHRENGEVFTMEVMPQTSTNKNRTDGTIQAVSSTCKLKFFNNILHVFETDTKRYFILDYMQPRSTLVEFVSQTDTKELVSSVYILAGICSALWQLHSRGGAYGHLHATNVYLDFDGHVKLARKVVSSHQWSKEERVNLRLHEVGDNEILSRERVCLKDNRRAFKEDWKMVAALTIFLLTGSKLSSKTISDELEIQAINTGYFSKDQTIPLWRDAIELFSLLWHWCSEDDFERLKRLPFFSHIDWHKVLRGEAIPPAFLLRWCRQQNQNADFVGTHKQQILLDNTLLSSKLYTVSSCNDTDLNNTYSIQEESSKKTALLASTKNKSRSVEGRTQRESLDSSHRIFSLSNLPSTTQQTINYDQTLRDRLFDQLRSTKEYLEQTKRPGHKSRDFATGGLSNWLTRSHTHIGSFRRKEVDSIGPSEYEPSKKRTNFESNNNNSEITGSSSLDKVCESPHFQNEGKESGSSLSKELSCVRINNADKVGEGFQGFSRSHTEIDGFTRSSVLARVTDSLVHIPSRVFPTERDSEFRHKTTLERAKALLDASSRTPKVLEEQERDFGFCLESKADMSIAMEKMSQGGFKHGDFVSRYRDNSLSSIPIGAYRKLSKSAENLLEDLHKANYRATRIQVQKDHGGLSLSPKAYQYRSVEELHRDNIVSPYRESLNKSNNGKGGSLHSLNSTFMNTINSKSDSNKTINSTRKHSERTLESKSRTNDTSLRHCSNQDLTKETWNPVLIGNRDNARARQTQDTDYSQEANSRPDSHKSTSSGRSKIPIKRSKDFQILPSKQSLVQTVRKEKESRDLNKSQNVEKETTKGEATISHRNNTSRSPKDSELSSQGKTKRHSLGSKSNSRPVESEIPPNAYKTLTGDTTLAKSNAISKTRGQKSNKGGIRPCYVEVEPVEKISKEIHDSASMESSDLAMLRRASKEFENDKETIIQILKKYNVAIDNENHDKCRVTEKVAEKKRLHKQKAHNSRPSSKEETKRKTAVAKSRQGRDSVDQEMANKGTQVTVIKRRGSMTDSNHGEASRQNGDRDDFQLTTIKKEMKDEMSNEKTINSKRETIDWTTPAKSASEVVKSSKIEDKTFVLGDDETMDETSRSLEFEKFGASTTAKRKFGVQDANGQSKIDTFDQKQTADTKGPKSNVSVTSDTKRGFAKGQRGFKFKRALSMDQLLQEIPETEESIWMSNDGDNTSRKYSFRTSTSSDSKSDKLDNRLQQNYTEKMKQADNDTFSLSKSVALMSSKIPVIRRYSSAECLTSKTDFRGSWEPETKSSTPNCCFSDGHSMSRVQTLVEQIPSLKVSCANDNSETKPANGKDGNFSKHENLPNTSELIQSLKVLSEHSPSRSTKNSPVPLHKEYTPPTSLNLSFDSKTKDQCIEQKPKIRIEEASTSFANRDQIRSARTVSVGSDSSYAEEEQLGESFNLSGSFDNRQEEMRKRRLTSSDSYLSVVQCSDDESALQHNELGRMCSFHSLRSVDSGLSDICNNSGGDEDTREYKSNQVDRSDSGVVKDLEKSLQSLNADKTQSQPLLNPGEWTPEDMDSAGDKPKRRPSTIEDPIECSACKRIFASAKNKGKSQLDPICPKCHSKRVERKEAIVELIQTEINYGNDLRILKEEFYSPIKNGGILNKESLTSIFLNLQELIDVNAKLCIKLQDELEECNRLNDEELTHFEVGKLFLDNADFFQAFELFCSKQRPAGELLENLQKKTEMLRIFLTVSSNQNTKLRKMDLKSFLTMPVQRIMKYPLLLSRIYRATLRGQPDKEVVRKAQRKIEEQINIINEIAESRPAKLRKTKSSGALNEPDTKDKLVKVCAQILNWKVEDTQIALSGSLEVGLGELIGTQFNRKNLRKLTNIQAVLCVQGASEIYQWDVDAVGDWNDLQFPTKSDVSEAAIILLKRKVGNKYTIYKEPVHLSQAIVCRHEGIPDAFELSPILREPFTFLGNSLECEHWYKCLHFLARDLGGWRQRRKAMANIMIQSMS